MKNLNRDNSADELGQFSVFINLSSQKRERGSKDNHPLVSGLRLWQGKEGLIAGGLEGALC